MKNFNFYKKDKIQKMPNLPLPFDAPDRYFYDNELEIAYCILKDNTHLQFEISKIDILIMQDYEIEYDPDFDDYYVLFNEVEFVPKFSRDMTIEKRILLEEIEINPRDVQELFVFKNIVKKQDMLNKIFRSFNEIF